MKKHLGVLVFCAMSGWPLLARADHHSVFVSTVVKFSDTDCAVELTIYENNQNGFEVEDNISFDGTAIATLTAVVDAGINAADGANDSGDTILAGSVDFDETYGVNADVAFDNASCASLTDSTVVAFNFAEGDTLDEADSTDLGEVTGFGENTAVTKGSTGATPELVDLSLDAVTVTNNAGESATLGTSDVGAEEGGDEAGDAGDTAAESSSSSGGCSLIP